MAVNRLLAASRLEIWLSDSRMRVGKDTNLVEIWWRRETVEIEMAKEGIKRNGNRVLAIFTYDTVRLLFATMDRRISH